MRFPYHRTEKSPIIGRGLHGLPVSRAIGGAEPQQLIARSLTTVPEPTVKDHLAFTGFKAKE